MKNKHMIIIVSCIIILFWIPITYLYQTIIYDTSNIVSTAEILAYYGEHKGYFGMDHGVKSIAYLALSLFPIVIFSKLSLRKYDRKESIYLTMVTTFGMLSFILISISLMIQAFSAEKLIELYNCQIKDKDIYLNLFELLITKGVLSYSVYLISYILYFIWIILIIKYVKVYSKKTSVLLGVSGILSLVSSVTIFIRYLIGINFIEISSLTDFLNIIIILLIIFIINGKEKYEK